MKDLSEHVLSVLSLPVSNAEVERVFSQVTILKTDLRNRLSTNTMENLLRIRFAVKNNNKCCRDYEPPNEMIEKFNSSFMYN